MSVILSNYRANFQYNRSKSLIILIHEGVEQSHVSDLVINNQAGLIPQITEE